MIFAEAAQSVTAGHNDFVLAGLLSLALVLGKGMEKLIEWVRDRDKDDAVVTAKLDDDSSRLLRETASDTSSIDSVVSVRDQNGTPMVYFPRQVGEDTRNMARALQDIASTNERTVAILERIDSMVQTTNNRIVSLMNSK